MSVSIRMFYGRDYLVSVMFGSTLEGYLSLSFSYRVVQQIQVVGPVLTCLSALCIQHTCFTSLTVHVPCLLCLNDVFQMCAWYTSYASSQQSCGRSGHRCSISTIFSVFLYCSNAIIVGACQSLHSGQEFNDRCQGTRTEVFSL